jgi:hypothetical protein
VIQLPVNGDESSPRVFGRRKRLPHISSRERASETPGYKQIVPGSGLRVPVRELAAIEHKNLAGESACPTQKPCCSRLMKLSCPIPLY